MKKIFFGLTLILSASVISANAQAIAPSKPSAQSTGTAAQANISFKEPENTHDFGSVPQGIPVTYNFSFTNTGKAQLILSSVNPSCGCTSPEWPKEPIAPGKSAVIKVTYNAAAPGPFTKNVTIVSNAVNPQTVLYIKGEVKPASVASQGPTAPSTQQASSPKKN